MLLCCRDGREAGRGDVWVTTSVGERLPVASRDGSAGGVVYSVSEDKEDDSRLARSAEGGAE